MDTKGNSAIITLCALGVLCLVGGAYFFLSVRPVSTNTTSEEAALAVLVNQQTSSPPQLISPVVPEAYTLKIEELPKDLAWQKVSAVSDVSKLAENAIAYEMNGKSGFLTLSGIAWQAEAVRKEDFLSLKSFEEGLAAQGWLKEAVNLKDFIIKAINKEKLCHETRSRVGFKNNQARFIVIKIHHSPCTHSDSPKSYYGTTVSLFVSDLILISDLKQQILY